MNRRTLLGGALAAAVPAFPQSASRPIFAYVGSYTTEQRKARGDGIHVYRMDAATGAWTEVQKLGNLVNPSFLILSRDQRFLYSVHGDENYANSYAIDGEKGTLSPLNRAETGGGNGVHLAFDPTGRFLVVANYGAGTVAVLPVRLDGTLDKYTQLFELKGEPGPHRIEQASSHPHDIVFDPSGRYVAVPDKGLDRVFLFRFDQGKLTPTEQGSIATRAGSGPRHMAFHPTLPVAWVLNELNSSVTTYHFDGAMHPIQILPSLPSDFTGDNTAAEIVVSSKGRYVYCTNRGHDSIAVFSVDAKTGKLAPVAWTPSQGKSPRFISFDPSQRFLYATNEQGDTIVTFRVDSGTGRLTPTGQVVKQGSPVTIAFTRGVS